MADKPSWLKGNSDVEWSYNIIAEWLSSGIMQAATKPDRDSLAVLQALVYEVLTAARQAAAQDAYEQAARLSERTNSHGRFIAELIRALAAAEAGKEGEK